LKKITKIEQQKSNPKRFNIYLDDVYHFATHEDILVSYRLSKGKEVDSLQLEQILRAEEINKIKQRCFKYISFKSRTKKEAQQYLLRQGFEKEAIDQVLRQLINEKWIDDTTFAKKFVEQRLKLKPRGKKLLVLEMQQKGINDEDIQASISQIDDTKEVELASQIVEKRITKYQGEDWKTIQRKLGGYLSRKGFSFTTITSVINHYKDRLLLLDE